MWVRGIVLLWVWDMWFAVSVRYVSWCECETCDLLWVWGMWVVVVWHECCEICDLLCCECETCDWCESEPCDSMWVWGHDLLWAWDMWLFVSVRYVICCECEICALLWVNSMWLVVGVSIVICCVFWEMRSVVSVRHMYWCEFMTHDCETCVLLWVWDMWFDVSVLLLFLLGSTLLVFHGIPLCHYLYRFASTGTTFHLIHIDLSLPLYSCLWVIISIYFYSCRM